MVRLTTSKTSHPILGYDMNDKKDKKWSFEWATTYINKREIKSEKKEKQERGISEL